MEEVPENLRVTSSLRVSTASPASLSSRFAAAAEWAWRNRSLLIPLLLAAWFYFPLTRVYFWGDDFSHFIGMRDHGLLPFYLDGQGGHLYLVRNLFYAPPYLVFGLKPEPYGWISLFIHLANVALFFRVASRLCHDETSAAVGAAVWGTTPVLSEALGNYCVNGHALTATALLTALLILTRDSESVVSTRTAALCAIFLWIGSACFGVGLGIALAFPFIVLFLVRRPYARLGAVLIFLALPVVVAASYVARKSLFVHLYGPEIGFPMTFAGVAMRVITDFSSLTKLVGQFFSAGIADLTWTLGTSALASPVSGVLSADGATVAASLVLIGFVVGDVRARLRMVGLVLLTASAYLMIALGRIGFAGDVARTTRYHYTGPAILALLLTIGLAQLARLIRLPRRVGEVLILAYAWLVSTKLDESRWRIDEHQACRDGIDLVLRRIDAAIAAAPPGADVNLEEEGVPGCWIWPDVHHSAGLFLITHPSNVVNGHRVRFAATHQELEMLKGSSHRRFGTLLYERTQPSTPQQ